MATGIVCLRYLQPDYSACFSSAFSSLNAALENVTSIMSAVVEAYYDFHFKMATIREGAKAAAESLCILLRQWCVEFTSNILFSGMVFLNPKLSAAQQSQLLVIMSRAMEQLLVRGYLDEQLMRSIVTLASPDHGTSLLLNYVIEAFTAFACNSSRNNSLQVAQARANGDQERDHEEDKEVAHVLIKQYAIERVFVAAMSPGVRKAVFQALRDGAGSEEDPSNAGPICCITLEPLLWPDCTVTMDVVAVIQRNHRYGKEHAFLYRGCALYDWLGRRQMPINPETRSIVKPTDVYRLS